jgi:hypothetical protein
LTRLALAEELAGDADAVHIHVEKALALVDPVTDPLRAALIRNRLCWSLFITGRPAAALAAAAAAVELVPETPPTLARVVVLTGLGRIQILVGRGSRAARAAVAATMAAEQIHDPVATALVCRA